MELEREADASDLSRAHISVQEKKEAEKRWRTIRSRALTDGEQQNHAPAVPTSSSSLVGQFQRLDLQPQETDAETSWISWIISASHTLLTAGRRKQLIPPGQVVCPPGGGRWNNTTQEW